MEYSKKIGSYTMEYERIFIISYLEFHSNLRKDDFKILAEQSLLPE